MRLEPQGYGECLLATFAALSGVPLGAVRYQAFEYSNGVNWWSYLNSNPWGAEKFINKICKETNLNPDLFPVNFDFSSFSWKSFYEFLLKENESVSLHGKGSICVISASKNCIQEYTAHVMPFENGKLFDLSFTPIIGETYEEYCKKRDRFYIKPLSIERI